VASKRKGSTGDPLIELAKRRFKQAQDATDKQRTRELDDIRFYNGDQWPSDVLQSRKGSVSANGLPPTPERPSLVINKLIAPVRQVLNEQRSSDMGIEIVPADDFGTLDDGIDHTEIELREGLVRRIQRQSNSQDAWTWAFERAVIGGIGYVGVMTRYVGGKSFDQEIYFQRFYNQACVSLDPAHDQPDGSDAEWGFVWTDMPYDQYKAEFPYSENGKDNPVCDDTEWRALGNEAPDWFITGPKQKGDKDADRTRMCRVGDYYYTERKTRELVQFPDGQVIWKDEVPDDIDLAQFADVEGFETRRVVEKTIKWCKIDGCQVLERTDWPGKYIPIIKIVGDELQPCDNERRVQGMVRPSKDSARGFNYMVSKQVETVGLTPIPPIIVEEGTIEGYEDWYKAANTRALPYLPWKRANFAGQDSGRPEAMQRQSQIADISMSIREFDAAIKSTTIVPDPTLGEVDPSLKSGKAINAILAQAQRGTSNFLDNLVRSMRYGALVVNDLLYPIYGNRPGRLARIIGKSGEADQVLIGQPFVKGQNGRPMPLQEGQQPPPQQEAKSYKLTPDADFNVAVKITKNYDTQREKGAAMLGEIIGSDPVMMTWFGDLFFKNTDIPGHDELAERAKLMLAPPIQQSLNQPEDQKIPPQVQQEMAKMAEVLKATTAELQQKTQIIETEQVKAQQQTQLAKVKADQDVALEAARQGAETERAQLDAANKIELERMRIVGDLLKTRATLEAKQTEAMIDAAVGELDREVQMAGEREERESVTQEADKDRAFQSSENAAGREQERELTAAQLEVKQQETDTA
jgi:hypothetical protein